MDSQTSDFETSAVPELDYSDPPAGSDRRTFMVRSAMATAIVALGGQVNPLWAQAPADGQPVKLDPNLQVVKDEKGHTFLEIPITVAAASVIIAPVLAAVGAIAAMAAHFTVAVERAKETSDPPTP